jgi:hypothetical protein
LDLEPGLQIARVLPELDLLDVAYGAVRGGAQIVLVPVTAFVTSTSYSPDLFNRPGLPLFAVKTELEDLDRIPGLGVAPDRIVVVDERNRTVQDPARAADIAMRVIGSNQEIGILAPPEPSALKDLSRAKIQWVYFSTDPVFNAGSRDEAEAELARLNSAALAANKVRLRVALFGPTGRHLPPSFAAIPFIEEIYPTPDLWSMALRLGWEHAVAEYRNLLH